MSLQNRHEGFEENGEHLAIPCFKFRYNDNSRFEHNSRVSEGEEFLVQVISSVYNNNACIIMRR